MTTLARLAALSAWMLVTALSVSAAADYEGASGYDSSTSTSTYELEVSHDGYPRGGETPGSEAEAATEPPSYVVIEVQEGAPQEVEGETVIVVQEPEPIAASEVAPPPPRVVAVDKPVVRCSDGIWVDGYWTYGDGQYLWVEGHCVVERVNYVFVHPRWDFYSSVWWFVPGYYRPCGVWVGYGYYRPHYWFPPYHRPYYRGYRGVPVHRGVPRRPTVRGVTPTNRVRTVGRRTPGGYGRTPTVNRAPTRTVTVDRTPTRTGAVNRVPPTRGPTVNRVPPTRTGAVNRVRPTRGPTVNRAPPTRTGAVNRVPATRGPTVNRAPPTRTGAVTRLPPTRGPAVHRTGRGPTLTSTVPRSPSGVVSQPRVNPTRTTSVSRSAAPRRPSSGPRLGGFSSRPSTSPSRTGTVQRPASSRPSSSGIFGRSRTAPSRPSMSPRPSFGRSGGFARPSSGGFGGARSVPTARGR